MISQSLKNSPCSVLMFVITFLMFPLVQMPAAQTTEEYIYQVQKTTSTVTVDGELNEPIWNDLPVAADFWMSYPVDDRRVNPARRTEVRLASDDQFLYIGVVCYGPREYVIKTLKRDNEFMEGDGFGIVLDPVNEKTNGFAFGVNPAGVQTEYLVTGQLGRREDPEPGRQLRGVNVAWDNKWLSEVINYPDKWVAEIAIPFKTLRFDAGKATWGVNFFRLDAGTNSIHTWSPVPIEFREYDLGYTATLRWDDPPRKTKRNIAIIPYVLASGVRDYGSGTPITHDLQPGLDAKIPITSSLNLDVTLNPDFSQVEVDEQVINLTLFDIRLPEKRLFFLENSDVFEDFGIPPMRPFFSRRIGLDEDGNPIPILYGARLSGNINKDLRLGLMNLQTRETGELLSHNYSVISFHQQVLSRSVVKGYFHNRQGINSEGPSYNRNAGLEFQYRSTDGRFQTFGGYSKAFSPGIRSRNYFYHTGIRYDNKNISIYSNLSGTGVNYQADIGYFRGPEYYDASRDTTIKIGYNHLYSNATYTFYPESPDRVISHEVGIFRHTYDVDTSFSLLTHEIEPGYSVKFASTSQVYISFNHTTVNLLYPFTFIDEEPLPSGIYKYSTGELRYESDQRRLFSLNGTVSFGSFYNGTRARYLIGIKYRAQPWGNFSVNFEQNNLEFPEPHGTDNLFLISPRVEINFSRALFWTTFLQYNTQDDNFNINSRFQWRFQPMSDLYIVYTDNYAVEFWGPKHRALVIKLNYWFNL